MAVIRASDRPMAAGDIEGLRARTLLDPEAGAAAVTLGELILDPGAELPLHRHRVEEAFFIIEGQGTLLLGEETVPIGAGDALLAPAGAAHGFRNDSDSPLRMTFFYPTVDPWTEFV